MTRIKPWLPTLGWAALLCFWLGWGGLTAWWHDVLPTAIAGLGALAASWGLWVAGGQRVLAQWKASLDANKGELNQEAEIIMAAARARDDWVRRHVGGAN
jgi:hypothetical protein